MMKAKVEKTALVFLFLHLPFPCDAHLEKRSHFKAGKSRQESS